MSKKKGTLIPQETTITVDKTSLLEHVSAIMVNISQYPSGDD